MSCIIRRTYLDSEFFDIQDPESRKYILVIPSKFKIPRSRINYLLKVEENLTCSRIPTEDQPINKYGIEYKNYMVVPPEFVSQIKTTGTSNIGNSCYFNSVLILLWHIHELRFIFDELSRFIFAYEKMLQIDSRTSVVPLFKEMMKDQDFSKVKDPYSEKSLLKIYFEHHFEKAGFSFGSMHASDSMLMFLLHALDNLFGMAPLGDSFSVESIPKDIQYKFDIDKLFSFDFRNMFTIHTTDKFGSDGNIEIQFLRQSSYMLEIPNNSSVSLNKLFDEEQKKHLGPVVHYSSTYFFLIISRSPEPGEKKGSLTDFHKLTINDKKYECIGLSRHIGKDCTAGHYLGYIKIGDQWYLFDDKESTPISDDDIPGDGMIYLFRLLDKDDNPVPYIIGELDDSILKALGVLS